MKKFIAMIISVSMIMCASQAFATDTSPEEVIVGTPQITVNGESVDLQSTNLSTYMYEENGNTMVPVRAVAEKMGYEVNWNGEDMSVTVESDTWKVVMYIGVDNYFGVTKIKDAVGMSAPQSYNASPCLIEDTTFVPAKMFELMGYSYSAVGQFVNFEDRNASTQIANPVVPIAESVK